MEYNNPLKRHDFIVLYEVVNGNPNGDPDRNNQPRQNEETGHGIVSDVCIKRKIRDYMHDVFGLPLYVQAGYYLEEKHREAYQHVKSGNIDELRRWMCQTYIDVRLLGAVMNTGEGGKLKCGTVHGPVSIATADSLSPIYPLHLSIGRCAQTGKKDGRKGRDGEVKEAPEDGQSSGTFGDKWVVPYALNGFTGSYCPCKGEKTGVSANDLAYLWEALERCWQHDTAAARPCQGLRGLWVFTHADKWGSAHVHEIHERVLPRIHLRDGVTYPRSFADYEVGIDLTDLPEGITVETRLPGQQWRKRAA